MPRKIKRRVYVVAGLSTFVAMVLFFYLRFLFANMEPPLSYVLGAATIAALGSTFFLTLGAIEEK